MNTNSNLEFRKIPSLQFLYEINSNGTIIRNVKSKKQSKIKLDTHHSEAGYYAVWIHVGGRKNSKTLHRMVHKLVAECWLGPCPDGYEVDHIDRNTHNNNFSNLRYVTKSEQMKNRDYTNISARGSKNLEEARELRKKPVILVKNGIAREFESFAEASRVIGEEYGKTFDCIRSRLKAHRSRIFDYDIIYGNAETKHGSSTEQEIVHKSDLTGDYKTAFNTGKQHEAEDRVKHLNT